MRKINNPFIKANDRSYGCFGCSPANVLGLRLEFWDKGEEVVAFWNPEARFEGFHDILHGGIQATLMDEIASWYIFAKCGTAGVTSGMQVKYLKPLPVSAGEITISARLREQAKRMVTIACKLAGRDGTEYATADVSYFVFPENVAREKYRYPGIEAFSAE